MKKFVALIAVSVAAVVLLLAMPRTGHAQPPPDNGSGNGFGNYLFDKWVDNRRAARGEGSPATYNYRTWLTNNPDDNDNTLGNRLFNRWIDNRRARRGR